MGNAVLNASQWKWLPLFGLLIVGNAWAVAVDEDYNTDEDIGVAQNIFLNDTLGTVPFTIESWTAPAHGVVTISASGIMNYQPDANFAGDDEFDYTIMPSDPACGTAMPPAYCSDRSTATVSIEINAVADAPLFSAASVVGDEDTTIGLSLAATQVDTDGSEQLFLMVGGVPSGATIAGGTEVSPGIWEVPGGALGGVAYVPAENDFGAETLTFGFRSVDTAGNTDMLTGSTAFTVNVTGVDDPPETIDAPRSASFFEEQVVNIDINGMFQDVDDPLSLVVDSVTGDPVYDPGTVNISGFTLTATLLPNQVGNFTVRVRASDASAPAFGDVNVEVTNLNDSPTLVAPIADVSAIEDQGSVSVSLAGVFDDVDITTAGDNLTYSYSVSGDAVFASDNLAGDLLTFVLEPNANGTVTVNVIATDSAGATEDDSFTIDVAAVNDPPTVIGAIGTLTPNEDDLIPSIDLETVFEDVDVLTNGDTLAYDILSNSDPSLFDDLSISGHILTIDLAQDANGTATIVLEADDGSVQVTDSFTIVISFVNDFPLPADDTATMNEDETVVIIDVLANDYLADPPTILLSAGTGGFSDSPNEFTYIDEVGDPIAGPNGTVAINAGQIEYRPKENFHGVDTFTYTIQDCCLPGGSTPGEVSPPATVTVTVTPTNDLPSAQLEQTYYAFEGEVLTVEHEDGLVATAYDIDYSLLDAGGEPIGGDFFADLVDSPTPTPAAFSFATDGSFTFTPAAGYTGVTTFTFLLRDDTEQNPELHTARIVVQDRPDPPEIPDPGEVAVNFDLADTPLEQASGVTPNVLMVMDDSGSMDWDITSDSSIADGIFRANNDEIATDDRRSTSFTYVWTLPGNTYGPSNGSGRAVPTEEALEANSATDDNEYGVWRARSSKFNVMYYDPTVQYEPWVGYDSANNPFVDADPGAVRLDPIDSTDTIDLLEELDYTSNRVPRWQSNGGTINISNTVYIPRYYTTTATGVPAWDDQHTLVEICTGLQTDGEPCLTTYDDGSDDRTDCAVNDDDPSVCTYAEEIQNFANWFQYYRKREYVAKAAVAAVLENVNDLRVGYETLHERASVDVEPLNELISEGHKKLLMDEAFGVYSANGTPLRNALERAGEIYSCSDNDRECPVLDDPDGTCQQNFTLLFSDGYWNGSGNGVGGDQDADGVDDWDGGIYADGNSSTLADTAMYYYENDLHLGLENRVVPTTKDKLARPTGSFDDGDRMHQHMKTFTIAFGLEGTLDPATVPTDDPSTTFTWPDPTSSDAAKIDDLLHAAVNGRGEFLSATRPTLLREAIEQAFDEFSDAQSSTSSASFNSTSLRDGTLLYRGFYDLEDNTGELTATAVDADGVLAETPTWSAADQLNPSVKTPSSRRLVSFNPDPAQRVGVPFTFAGLGTVPNLQLTENQVDWSRGDQSLEGDNGGSFRDRDAARMLGDIVNSSPVFVGEPRGFNRDQAPFPTSSGNLYSDFVETYKNRQPVVYVGANDGMLHGFAADTGEELFGYVPNRIVNSTARFANEMSELTDPFYAHKYYVDLSPRLNDVFMKASTTAGGKSWNTVMVGGLGGGGKGFFALNVTNPGSAFSSDTNAAGTVLWEFSEEDDTYPVDSDGNLLGGGTITDPDNQPVKDLGYSLSLPTIAMSNAQTGGEQDWVAIFGNGPNSTSGIAKLFVLRMDGGLDGWDDAGDFYKLDTGRGVPITEPAELIGYPNGLGSPTAIDEDLNGTVDLVYAGDRLGNLYRFDMRDSNPDNWKSVLVFTASYTDSGNTLRQPILSRPLVVPHPTQPGYLVIFGTGSYVTTDDASDDSIQSMYGIWDPAVSDSPFTADPDSKDTRLVEQVITNVVVDSTTPFQTRRVHSDNTVEYQAETVGETGVYGWYIDFDMPRAEETLSGALNPDTSGNTPPAAQFPGERAIRRFIIRNGNVVTTTVLPSTGEASCFGTRPGSILLFSGLTGGSASSPTIDFNTDGDIDEDDLVEYNGNRIAGGLLLNQNDLDGSLVDLSTLGGQGDSDFLFVSGGNDTIAYRIEDVNDPRTGRLSWNELQND